MNHQYWHCDECGGNFGIGEKCDCNCTIGGLRDGLNNLPADNSCDDASLAGDDVGDHLEENEKRASFQSESRALFRTP